MSGNLSGNVENDDDILVNEILERSVFTNLQIDNGTQGEIPIADWKTRTGLVGPNVTFPASICTFKSAGVTLLAHCASFHASVVIVTSGSVLFDKTGVTVEIDATIVSKLELTKSGAIGPVPKTQLIAAVEDMLHSDVSGRDAAKLALHSRRQIASSKSLPDLPLHGAYLALDSAGKLEIAPNILSTTMTVTFEINVEVHVGVEGRIPPAQDQAFIDAGLTATLTAGKLTKVSKTVNDHPVFVFITED
jgi:hypothetical protein